MKCSFSKLHMQTNFPEDVDNKFYIQLNITKESGDETLTNEELNNFVRDLNDLLDKTFDSSYSTILITPNLYTETQDE